MVFQNGEIEVSPYTLYWIQMPPLIGEADRIELLKKDVFVIDCQYTVGEYQKLIQKKDHSATFFFNLDKIISTAKPANEYDFAGKIAKFIAGFSPDKSVIHTTSLDENMKEIFQREGLIYLEKNFNDKEGAVSIIMNLLKPLFSSENQIRRSFIRINMYPHVRYKVELIASDRQTVKTGFLKDVSMNGLCAIMPGENDLDYYSLKDTIQLRVFTQSSILKIPLALVTRKNAELKEIGVSYNVNDPNMIREETANFFTKIVYRWIKEFIDHHGKLS